MSRDDTSVSGEGRERVAIFIDGSNLYHSLEENCGRFDLDFGAFAEKLCRGAAPVSDLLLQPAERP